MRCLRYGPPYYRTHTGPGRYDWSFAADTFGELPRLGIVPIVDLCHFGLPDWLGNFQNPDFPRYFEEYAQGFSRRYPWVWLYTPDPDAIARADHMNGRRFLSLDLSYARRPSDRMVEYLTGNGMSREGRRWVP